MLLDLIIKNRSCRRFYQEKPVSIDTLKGLINLARLSASAANLQPLNYILSCDASKNSDIFSCLGWAGYLPHWPGPREGERPSAYIIILGNEKITRNFECDHGIASQSILLGAREQGLAGCIIANIKREKLRTLLNIPDHYKVLLVLAMGVPKEEVIIDEIDLDGSIKYWRDKDERHHVPKRRLSDILIKIYDKGLK